MSCHFPNPKSLNTSFLNALKNPAIPVNGGFGGILLLLVVWYDALAPRIPEEVEADEDENAASVAALCNSSNLALSSCVPVVRAFSKYVSVLFTRYIYIWNIHILRHTSPK